MATVMSTSLSGAPISSAIPASTLRLLSLIVTVYVEAGKHLVDELEQFNLVDERVGSYNVGVTLVKFAVTAFLRSVGTPHGLNLETLEGETEVRYGAGQRNAQMEP